MTAPFFSTAHNLRATFPFIGNRAAPDGPTVYRPMNVTVLTAKTGDELAAGSMSVNPIDLPTVAQDQDFG